jgi:hypothetical protein
MDGAYGLFCGRIAPGGTAPIAAGPASTVESSAPIGKIFLPAGFCERN